MSVTMGRVVVVESQRLVCMMLYCTCLWLEKVLAKRCQQRLLIWCFDLQAVSGLGDTTLHLTFNGHTVSSCSWKVTWVHCIMAFTICRHCNNWRLNVPAFFCDFTRSFPPKFWMRRVYYCCKCSLTYFNLVIYLYMYGSNFHQLDSNVQDSILDYLKGLGIQNFGGNFGPHNYEVNRCPWIKECKLCSS